MSLEDVLRQRRQQLRLKLEGADVRIMPWYSTARDRIIQPHRNLVVTNYFVDRWLHRLGPDRFALVVAFRRIAAEVAPQDSDPGISLSYPELVEVTGLSRSTLKRLLSDESMRDTDVGLFIRKQEQFQRDLLGHHKQAPNLYVVRMDDPIAPEDRGRLLDEMVDMELMHDLGLASEFQSGTRAESQSGPQGESQRGTRPDVHWDTQPEARVEPGRRAQFEPGRPVQNEPRVPERPAEFETPHGRPRLQNDSFLAHEESSYDSSTAHLNSRTRTEGIAEAEALARKIAKELRDEASLGFYRKIAFRFLAAGLGMRLLDCLELTKDAMKSRRIEKPGAYFNRAIQVEAELAGVDLFGRGEESPEDVRRMIQNSLGDLP